MNWTCNACGMMAGEGHDCYAPAPPMTVGSERWKDDLAFRLTLKLWPHGTASWRRVYLLPTVDGHHLGVLVVEFKADWGTKYWRVDPVSVPSPAALALGAAAKQPIPPAAWQPFLAAVDAIQQMRAAAVAAR